MSLAVLSILVVDANREHSAAMCRLLLQERRAGGYAVHCVASLAEALAALDLARDAAGSGDRIDAILLSLALPEAPGLAAFAALRARAGGLPIVVLSDPGDEPLAIRAVRDGAADYLVRDQYHVTLLSRSLRHAAHRQTSRAALLEGERAAESSAAELASRNAQRQQAQKLESIGRLAGGIAHDFNNLLMVILTNTEFARESLTPVALPATRSALDELDEIAAAARRAAALTRQLLLFSRRQVVQPELLGLNDVVARAEAQLRRLVAAEVQLQTSYDATPDCVLADRGQLEQVVVNLVVNARDAMPFGGVVTIRTGNSDVGVGGPRHGGRGVGEPVAPGPYVTLTVADTGEGIDAITQQNIWEPFFTTRAVGRGTGLGLATVYGIVSQLDGSIALRTAPGDGAAFTIYLPLATPVASRPARPMIDRTGRTARSRLG